MGEGLALIKEYGVILSCVMSFKYETILFQIEENAAQFKLLLIKRLLHYFK